MKWARGALVGRGSFCTVNFATPIKNNGDMPPTMAVKSTLLSQASCLRREGEILSRLQGCPQILQCFGSDITTENCLEFYNVFLEYVSGGTLADLIKKSGRRMAEDDVSRYVRSILEGIGYIHEKGFVHCDMKPRNILVCSPSSCSDIKIADFGLAKKGGEKPEDGFRLVGTPLYMAPESVANGVYEAPSDIWSLGCIIAEMMTGVPAWRFPEDSDINALLFRIGFSDELPEIPCQISEQGRDFLSRCFDRDPMKRWTAEMLLNHPFVADEATEGRGKSLKIERESMSPTSAFDFPPWCSVQSSSSSACSTWENFFGRSQEEMDPVGIYSSPTDRIHQLTTTGSGPDWSDSGGWITVRKAESSVFQSQLKEGKEKSSVFQSQLKEANGRIFCVKSDSLMILEEMMTSDGRREVNSDSNEVAEEELQEFNASTSSTADEQRLPLLFTSSIQLPQFEFGSDNHMLSSISRKGSSHSSPTKSYSGQRGRSWSGLGTVGVSLLLVCMNSTRSLIHFHLLWIAIVLILCYISERNTSI